MILALFIAAVPPAGQPNQGVYVLDAGVLNINPPTSLPLPTGASTETTLAAIKAKTDNLDVALSSRTKPADSQHVTVDSAPTTAVTGAFYQATQPVSLATAPATPVTGTFWQTTQPVSGTFWQATQPVSGTVTANAAQSGVWTVQPGNTANTTAWKVDGSAVTQPVSLTSTTITGTVAATQSGTWSDRIVGNAGAAFDAANNAAAPANVLATSAETISSGGQPSAAASGNVRRIVAGLDGVQFVREGGPVTWCCGVNSVAAALTQCQAAPGANLSLYITSIVVQTTTTTSGTYALQYGTGANCGTGTAQLFPATGNTAHRFNAPVTTQSASSFTFTTGMKVTENNALCLVGVATNTITANICGFTAK